jgi:integral membrane sensor domain MASE1
VVYFLAARLGLGLVLEPAGVAVFWPAAGISSGILIALGVPRAGWPVALGVTLATVAVHELVGDPLWAGTALGLSNAAEALITAALIRRYFGSDVDFDRPYQVLGLLLAAMIGPAVSGIGAAAIYRLWNGPAAPLLTIWQNWFASDAIGILIVAPLVVGLAAALRYPPPRSELIEATAALVVLALMTAIALFMPQTSWETVVPVALLFQCCCGLQPDFAPSSPRQPCSWSPWPSFRPRSSELAILATPLLRSASASPRRRRQFCLWRLARIFSRRYSPSAGTARHGSRVPT